MKNLLKILLFSPILICAQTQVGQTLYGNSNSELFGTDLAFSNDNTRMVVVDHKDESGSITGHVKVFDLINNVWTQVGQTLNGEAIGLLHSLKVSISGDGQRIAVGTSGNSTTVLESGNIKIYEYLNGSWNQISQTILPISIGELFAFNFTLSKDGNSLVSSAQYYSDNGIINEGYVKVFYYSNGTWLQKGSTLYGSYLSRFGTDVALSLDGNILVCSSIGNGANTSYIKFFEYINNDWIETSIINESLSGERFGSRIVLTPDAKTIVVRSSKNENDIQAGRVTVFTKINGNWMQKGSTLNGLNHQDVFGQEISISDDGNILVVGSPLHDFEGSNMGYINLYKYLNNDWVLKGEQIRGYNNSDLVGASFSLSSDGNELGIGFQYDDTNATNSGKVIVYNIASVLSIEEFNTNQFNFFPNPAKDQFTIKLENTKELQNVTVYNNLGQQVLTSKKAIINTSKLASGLYIVEIETNKGKGSKKLIIE